MTISHFKGEYTRTVSLAATTKYVAISSINIFFAQLPSLDKKDSLKFEQEIQELRAHQHMEGDLWG